MKSLLFVPGSSFSSDDSSADSSIPSSPAFSSTYETIIAIVIEIKLNTRPVVGKFKSWMKSRSETLSKSKIPVKKLYHNMMAEMVLVVFYMLQAFFKASMSLNLFERK